MLSVSDTAQLTGDITTVSLGVERGIIR